MTYTTLFNYSHVIVVQASGNKAMVVNKVGRVAHTRKGVRQGKREKVRQVPGEAVVQRLHPKESRASMRGPRVVNFQTEPSCC
jgi:hypothetical protein